LFNIVSGIVLLVLIAVYDAYAVWKSKHMITLAKSQAKAKMFSGLLIPYQIGRSKKKLPKVQKIKKKVKIRTAMLGGGDIGFPLIFAGIILKELGLWQSLVIPFFAAAALGILFWKADEKKFYPAMPFIGAGCLIGLGVVMLIGLI
jgi:presenilin-like A22 family membrane protease